ncbi:hypothetical protein [Paenibacillus sp. GCM10027626]|uniref:hypothetical protein n=1 Tax=Paenibacillus sp. GCM10027626 TaxID=3273411 RepID=UPI0036363981
MLHRVKIALMLSLITLFLSGCLYPKEKLAQNQKPAKDALMNVQLVVDKYQKDTGLLPIRNSEPDTPRYEKFMIDFDKLLRMNYVSEIPASAFEKGGSYYFLVINEETDPTVKLMNLAQFQKINDVQNAVAAYKNNNGGKLPAGEKYYPDFYLIDYSKLSVKEPEIQSVFSGQTLHTLLDEMGKVYIDYAIDISQMMPSASSGYENMADLRELLVEQSDFVPVKSPGYKLINGEPQAVLEP